MELNHSLIGSFPEVEAARDTLDHLMAEWFTCVEPVRKTCLEMTIKLSAMHFYGIDALDMHTAETIDAIRAMDQELEFA
jgi:hypothetical protein